MGFIYKITNIITNKCYIGETKQNNPESRWKEHKNTIKNGVGCPALRDAVKKYGIENFKFNILLICFDEDRYKYEIEYIKKYNSIVPNGYNILKGGPGGSFQGKTHSEETKKQISAKLKQKYIDNPELKKEMSERNKILMNSEVIKNKISEGVINSKKYQQMIKDKKVGNYNNNLHTEESKNKIRESIKKYYNNNEKQINIIKHREAMAKSVGIKISQYDLNNILINNFVSFADASRQTGIPNSTIKKCVKNNITNRRFIWKKEII
jgi:group I intron endonuclease